MFFSSRYPAAIYIQKKALDFYVEGNQKHLEFPADTVLDGDIINPAKYEKLIEDFITAENIKKQPAILVLAEEILFEKTIPSEDIKLLDERLADFAGMVPVESEKLSKKSVKSENNTHLFVVNKQIFEKLTVILNESGFEVLAVVPLALYSSEDALDEGLVKKIYKDKELLKNSNFLNDSSTNDNTSSSKKDLFIIAFLLVVIFILGFILASIYLKLPLPFLSKETKSAVAPKISSTPVSTASATLKISSQSAVLETDQIKAMVLNGTGIAGQAAKIKDLLITLGILKIETDNVEGVSVKETAVIFSPLISSDLRKKITALLEENFDSVTVQSNSASESADILITTGKPKAAP